MPMHIYNVGSKTFITNNTPSVTDINSAVKWRVKPENGKYTFYREDNNGQWRLMMKNTWSGTKTGAYNETSGATDFSVIESTNGAYKFTASVTGSTRYFNVDGSSYTAAKNKGTYNDWLFISEAQKTAYTNYLTAYDEAKKLLTDKADYLNEEVALKSALEDILLETTNTKYSNSVANTKKLNDIINWINNPWSFTKKITAKAKYATICLPYNTKVPEGVTVKVVTEYTPGSHYVKTAVFANAGDIMPANNGFLLYAEDITEDTNYTFEYTSKAANAPGVNLLYGNVERREDYDNLSDVFVLAYKSTLGVGFYHLASGQALAANVAYMHIADNSIAANAKVFIDDFTTGVEAIDTEKSIASPAAIYDTLGRQSKAMSRGVNIVRMSDGSVRKVIIK